MLAAGDTIAAVASAPGTAARGVVRLSGPGVAAVLDAVLLGGDLPAGAHRVRLGWPTRYDPAGSLPALLLRYKAPRSYTGEDGAELCVPGSPVLLQRLLRAVLAGGSAQVPVRLAAPGEFSARACFHGKLTVEQAEGVAMTIAAEGAEELEAAGRLLRGVAGERCAQIADALADALALVEAGVDFTDQEDVVPISPDALLGVLRGVRARAAEGLAADGPRESHVAAVTAVLVGEPNAGKSTLMNALLGRNRVVESAVAGSTRDAIAEPLPRRGAGPWRPDVTLVDLPGLDAGAGVRTVGCAADASQDAARGAIQAAGVLLVCDPAGRFDGAFAQPAPGQRAVRVRTKADLVSGGAHGGASGSAGQGVSVCAMDGWNIEPLRLAVFDAAQAARSSGGALRIAPRHADALRRAVWSLDDAVCAVAPDAGLPALAAPEHAAASMRVALDALGEITGRLCPDEVLGRVFAGFCVGK